MNEILFVDKPKGITSFTLCNKIKHALNVKKVGHTGTLDPNATGLMIVLIDNATKLNQFLVEDKKEYIATVKLGIATDTLDIDGNIIEDNNDQLDNEDLDSILNSFLGKSKQTPPMTSAIKINGRKLYEYQRKGIEVEIKDRDIEIFEIELLSKDKDIFVFRTLVSKGTYIRVLVQDILKKINKIGTLSDLRRTKVDNIDIKNSNTLEDVLNNKYTSHDSYELLKDRYPFYEVNNKEDILNGKAIKIDSNEDKIVITNNNQVLAIYYKDNDVYRCLRGLL